MDVCSCLNPTILESFIRSNEGPQNNFKAKRAVKYASWAVCPTFQNRNITGLGISDNLGSSVPTFQNRNVTRLSISDNLGSSVPTFQVLDHKNSALDN